MTVRLFILTAFLTALAGCSPSAPGPVSAPSSAPPVVTPPAVIGSASADQSASATPAPATDANADELAKLQGIWQPITVESDGTAMTPAELKKYARPATFQGDKIIARKEETTTESPITIDPSHSPKWIDVVIQDGPDQGKTDFGIYDLDGDSLKLCLTKPGTERPADFTTKLGEPRIVTVYERQK